MGWMIAAARDITTVRMMVFVPEGIKSKNESLFTAVLSAKLASTVTAMTRFFTAGGTMMAEGCTSDVSTVHPYNLKLFSYSLQK